MEHSVQLFLEKQRRSDSRTAVFVINGDINVLNALVKESAAVDPGRTDEIMDTDVVDTDVIAALYLTAHTYRATYLGAIVASVVRVPHPTVAATVSSMESAMEFCQWSPVAWLTKRCYRHDEIRKVFEVASLPCGDELLQRVSLQVYNCMPIGWSLDKTISEQKGL